jgi:uncharacterized integral membrane protein
MTERDEQPQREFDYRRLTVVILAGIIVLVFVVFVVQNGTESTIEFLGFDITLALWLLVLIAMVAGAFLWGGLSWVRRRRKARRAT